MSRPAGSLQLITAIGAGLMTGLARFPDPVSTAGAILVGIAIARAPAFRAVSMGFLLGMLLALVVRRDATTHCANVLEAGRVRVELVAIDPGTGRGRVRPQGAGCHGSVEARWPDGSGVEAGQRTLVVARWQPRPGVLGRPGGTLLISSVGRVRGSSGLVARSRQAAMERSRRLFGSAAPLVDALIAGRRTVPRDLRDAFAASGMVHLLVISGFHIALVAGWVMILMRLTGLSRQAAAIVAALVALGYAGWLGWPTPATRAAVLLAVVVAAKHWQRRWRPDGLLGAAAAVVLLIDPWAFTRIGTWLSFAAVAGVLVALRWLRQAHPDPAKWSQALAASVGATLATAPLAAWGFGRVASIGVLLNLIAMPLAALIVPAVGLALLLDPLLPGLATAFAASGKALLAVLEALGRWGQTLPGSGVIGQDGLIGALPWLALLAVALVAVAGRSTAAEARRRAGWGVALILWVTLVWPARGSATSNGRLTLTFLDVGQGDAAVITTPNGHHVVVDAGPANDRFDAGERRVVPFLRRAGVARVDLLILSHPHLDHVGGAAALLDDLPVGMILDPGDIAQNPGYRAALREAALHRVPWRIAESGLAWSLDGVEFRVVHPARGWVDRGLDLNEDSVVLEVTWREFSALLVGDAGIDAERAYLGRVGRIDLLKVGHHGSRTATGRALLNHIAPDAAVMSLGINNYGHPAAITLRRLAEFGVPLWRTDRQGRVTVTTDGHTFTVGGNATTRSFDATDP